MTKRFLKKLALGFSTGVIATYGIIYACADGYWGYEFDSNFTPETYVDKSYSPLFLSSDTFYGIHFDDGHIGRFNDEILNDWRGYLGESIRSEAVEFLLLNDTARLEIENLYHKRSSNLYHKRFGELNLKDRKIRNFIEFLYKAKQLESYSTQTYNYWDYDSFIKKKAEPDFVRNFESDYQKTSDKFLKNRYWFQTVKAYFYADDFNGLESFIQNTEAKIPHNTLYYRAIAYLAGLNYANRNYEISNYLFAQVFDKCPSLRVTAMYNFKPIEDEDFNSSLEMATEIEEKAALWAMFGYYGDVAKAISEIYKINPKSKHIDFLLTRLVNSEESSLSEIGFKDIESYKTEVKGKLDRKALDLVRRIAEDNQTEHPYLWSVASGYLSVFNMDYDYAEQAFSMAEKTSPKTSLSKKQIRLLKLYNQVNKTSRIDKGAEARLLEDLNWLYYTCPQDNNDPDFRYQKAVDWTKNYISRLYMKQGNVVMAELFSADKGFYKETSRQENMKQFLAKQNKTAWEELATGIYDISLSDIYEYQAILSAYRDDLDQAIAYMEKTDKAKDIVLYGNPFNGRIRDCNDCDHEAPQKFKLTKLSFLKKMKDVKSQVAAGNNVYVGSFLLGNAFYNMSYFGNARVFYENKILNEYGNYVEEENKALLYGMSQVRKYYQQALSSAGNNEQRAKMTYMLSKTERNDFYARNYFNERFWWGYDNMVDFKAMKSFYALKNQYANTKYYQQVINECGYFRKFVNL